MNATRAIAAHELNRLFVSPLSWTLLAVTQLLLGILFALSLTDISLNPQTVGEYDGISAIVGGGVFRFATVVLLLVVPLLTMRAFAEERKSGNLDLMLSAPAPLWAIVLGKFAALMGYLSLMFVLIAAMPLSLALFTPLDLGLLCAGLIGLWLVMASFSAIGLFVSSLTREPTLAAVATLLGIGMARFAYTPLIGGSWPEILEIFFFALLGLYAFSGALQGHLENHLNWLMRMLTIILGIAMLWPASTIIHAGAALLFGVLLFFNIKAGSRKILAANQE
mgnify:CR=1 FL=1